MSTLREPLARPTPQKQGASAWLQHNLITGNANHRFCSTSEGG